MKKTFLLIMLSILLIPCFVKAEETNNNTEIQEENITESLCYGFSNLCQVKFNTLISWGYLDENLENPLTHEKVSENTTSYVEISWKDNEMICTFKEG